MTKDEDKDIEIELSPQVEEAMAADPELAKAMKDMFANFRQATHGVKSGQYKDFGEAMEAITGQRPQRIDLDEDGEVPE